MHDAALYCAGLVTPFVLVLIGLIIGPLLEWLDRVDQRIHARWDDQAVAEAPTEELEAVDDSTARWRFDTWDLGVLELTSRRQYKGGHRA